jgi:hypothetical protein
LAAATQIEYSYLALEADSLGALLRIPNQQYQILVTAQIRLNVARCGFGHSYYFLDVLMGTLTVQCYG